MSSAKSSAALLMWGVVMAAAISGCARGPAAAGGRALRATQTRETFPDPQPAFMDDVRAALDREQFDRLDELADELIRTKARFPGGDWKLYRFHDALAVPLADENASDAEWERHIARLHEWHDTHPRSMSAAIALSGAYVGYGWKARGKEFASKVTPEGWRLLDERLAPVEDILTEAGHRRPKNPQWYCAMIDLGRIQGWNRETVQALFEEAVTTEPLYLHVYSAMARYLMPRWQGDDGDWERFAEESADRLGGREGSVVYGHVAWQISKLYRGHAFFEENRVSWARIRQGFVDREALYGASLRNLNGFCLLAGSAADRTTTREIFGRIGERWDPEIWKERHYFDEYRKWAFE